MPSLRFRDGERDLPDQLFERFVGLDVRRMTYDEALEASNKREMTDYLNKEQQRVMNEHMAGLRRMGG